MGYVSCEAKGLAYKFARFWALPFQAFDEDAKKFYAPFGFLPFSDREPLMLILRISELRVALQS